MGNIVKHIRSTTSFKLGVLKHRFACILVCYGCAHLCCPQMWLPVDCMSFEKWVCTTGTHASTLATATPASHSTVSSRNLRQHLMLSKLRTTYKCSYAVQSSCSSQALPVPCHTLNLPFEVLSPSTMSAWSSRHHRAMLSVPHHAALMRASQQAGAHCALQKHEPKPGQATGHG